MTNLVALSMDGGPTFVSTLQRIWSEGNAVFVLDQRLPPAEAKLVMSAMAPSAIVEADGQQRSLQGGKPLRDGDALVVATSGTTGSPKGVVHTHEGLMASALATSKAISVDPSRDRWLACLPLAHVGGLSVVVRALLTDTPLEVHARFEASAAVSAARSGVTLVSLVTRALSQVDAGLFRTIVIGGAAPAPQRPSNVVATYGMTETGSGVVYERKPIDGVEIRVDADQEIWLRGPMLLRSYRDGNDPKDNNGWFATGDLGEIAEDGALQVYGRRGDVIVTGGEKVWPARVEPLLNRQPGISEAVLVGRPHSEWGHQVTAVVVAESDTAPDLAQIRRAVKAELPAWYAPTSIELVKQIPKTSLGKVRRSEI